MHWLILSPLTMLLIQIFSINTAFVPGSDATHSVPQSGVSNGSANGVMMADVFKLVSFPVLLTTSVG